MKDTILISLLLLFIVSAQILALTSLQHSQQRLRDDYYARSGLLEQQIEAE